MELQVKRPVGIDVVLDRRAVHALAYCAQLLELLRRRTLCHAPSSPLVERRPHFVELVGLGDANLADKDTAIFLEPDET